MFRRNSAYPVAVEDLLYLGFQRYRRHDWSREAQLREVVDVLELEARHK